MSTDKSNLPGLHQGIAKSACVVGVATLCSRLLGFIRDVVIARMFGVYVYAQAFVIAFKIPNLLRDFVGEGATNAAFIPVFSEYQHNHTREEFWELANVVLNLLLVALAVITVLGIIFAPLVVRLMAPGFIHEPQKLELTVRLTRIIFPYILLVGLAAYAMAILNSFKHFAAPAFAPCLLNISIIVCALVFGEGITGLASGILIGGVLQLAVQLPVIYRKGMRLNLFKRFRHPGARAIGMLMLPRTVSTSIYQLNNFVDSIFGSLSWIVGEGGVAVLYFSYRLILFPLGIFSTSLAQAILPTLSEQAVKQDYDNLRRTFSWGLRVSFFVLLPASLGLMVFSQPIIDALFRGNKFDIYASFTTARALAAYSLGLWAYGCTRMVQICFFALKDTVTPTKVAFLTLIMNVVLNIILMFPLRIAGIALATSISGIITFFILLSQISRRLHGLDGRATIFSLLRIVLASAGMTAVCFFAYSRVPYPNTSFLKALYLSGMLLSGVISYLFFCFVFRVKEAHQLRSWLVKRKI